MSHGEATVIRVACSGMSHCVGQPGQNRASAVIPVTQFGLIEALVKDIRAKVTEMRLKSSSIAAAGFQPLLPGNLRAVWNPLPLFDRLMGVSSLLPQHHHHLPLTTHPTP